ncbi:MAG: hypothetical protein ACTSPB_06785 [Candidatus Thorarchaeota archaeon]
MKLSKRVILIEGIILTGVIAGAIEATLGLLLHLQQIRQVGAIMTAVMFLVIVLGTIIFKPKNYFLFATSAGVLALTLKFFNFFVPGVMPGACLGPAGICLFPSMSAIFMEATSFGILANVFKNDYDSSVLGKVSVGILAAYVSFLGFGIVYKPVEALFWFTVRNGTIASLIAIPSISLSNYLGNYIRPITLDTIRNHPTAFLGITNSLILGSVGLTVFLV